MTSNLSAHTFRRQIILFVVLIFSVGVFAAYWTGKTAVDRVDAESAERQMRLVENAINARLSRLHVEQQNVTIWEDAVVNVPKADIAWIDANLGVWMQEYFGHDRSFIVTAGSKPFYAAVDRETVAPTEFNAVEPQVQPLIEEVMALVSEGATEVEDLFASANVELESGPAVASVVPIVSDTAEEPLRDGVEFYHVAIDYLDAEYVKDLSEGLELENARIDEPGTPIDGDLWLALRDPGGAGVARLVWTPTAPASHLVGAIMPTAVLWIAAVALLVVFLVRRLLETSTKLQTSEAQARFLAFHDPLTRLPNRALFDDRLRQALATRERNGPDVTLLMIDLDRFKNVNDVLGHPAGDELIRQVGDRIGGRIRRSDTVARLGGDEFAIVLIGRMDGSSLEEFCADLIDEISRPYDLFGSMANISASIGAAAATAAEADADEMVRRADIALYRSKQEGRARFHKFVNDMDEHVRSQDTLGRDLRRDTETRSPRLGVEYFPILDKDENIAGAITQLSWSHPDHVGISAETCLRVAEERGFIHALSLHVLDQACRFTARSRLPKVVVRVAAVQLQNACFAESVLALLDDADLSPDRLELQLPDKVVSNLTTTAERQLEMFREAGLSISLDERATTMFDLERMKEIGVNSLTIDGAFVSGLGKSPAAAVGNLQAILAFTRAVGLKAIACGAESSDQREILAALGCVSFYFLEGDPMSPMDLARLSDPEGSYPGLA